VKTAICIDACFWKRFQNRNVEFADDLPGKINRELDFYANGPFLIKNKYYWNFLMSLIAIGYPNLVQKDYKWIQSFRSKHDKEGIGLIRPHFTLIFPVDSISIPQMVNHVRPIVLNTPRISFEINSASLSPKPDGKTWFIFLVPGRGRNEIIKLHDRLYTGIFAAELKLEYEYLPHITIGRSYDRQDCLNRVTELNSTKLNIRGNIGSIEIAEYKNNRIRALERFELAESRSKGSN